MGDYTSRGPNVSESGWFCSEECVSGPSTGTPEDLNQDQTGNLIVVITSFPTCPE